MQALAIEPTASTSATLKNAGVTPVALNQVINDIRKGRTADSANAEQGFDSLKNMPATSPPRRAKASLTP